MAPAWSQPDESVYLSESSPPRPACLNVADSQAYLERIKLDKELASQPASHDLLSKLSVAHHLSVPFDTSALHVPLDAWSKRDDRRLGVKEGPGVELGKSNFERIVKRRHGGFCYSQNPLFASLLRGFGFRISEVPARVFMNRGKDPKEAGYAWSCNTHVALIVDWEGSDGRYLVDVGFGGGGPAWPIPLRDGQTGPSVSRSESFLLREEQMPVGEGHPIMHDPPAGWTLYRRIVPAGAVIPDHTEAESVPDSYWTPCIHFSLASMTPEDTLMGNHFNCTHDSAGFARVFVVSRLLENGGRQTLSRGIPAIDAGAPSDGTLYAKLYTKDSIKGEEYDVEWIPYDVKSIGKVLEEQFGFTL
ncbi:hypothetical protein JCM3774_004819 [Rhodotorula dairenensis]